MPPKRSNAESKAVEDERDGGGASAKRKSGFIPRKIVRGEVESGPAVPPAAAGPSSSSSAAAAAAVAAAGDTAVGTTTANVASIATATAISATSSKAVSASTSNGRTASAAGQASVSNAPAVGLELLPAKRTRVASMKARELAEQKRSGVLERSSDESDDDEPSVRGDGDNDIDYNSPGRRRLSAGKRGRRRRSVTTTARITENDFDDSDNEAVLASKSKRIVKKTPRKPLSSSSKQPIDATVATAARPATVPATTASPPQPKLPANHSSDSLPVTVAVIMASDSAAGSTADRLPASQSSPLVGIVRVPPAATTTTSTTAGSSSLSPAAQSSPNVVPVADAAAAPLPAAPSEPVGECYVLSSAALPTTAAAPLDAVPLVVAEATDGFQLSNASGESAGAVAGILLDQVIYPSQGMRECDDSKHAPAEEDDSEQPGQPPVTVAALNDDGGSPGDQGSLARLVKDESNQPETAIDSAALTAASVSRMLSASGELSSVTAAQVLSALSAIGSRSDGGIGEGGVGGGGSGRRTGVKKDGRSAAGSAVSAEQLTDGATAAAVSDRAQSSKPKTVECSICHKLVRRYDLNKHIKNVHSGDKPNKCPHCDYASPWKGNLNTHIAGVHLKARSHECSRCKLMFKTRGAMIGHVRKVHDRMYQPTERNFECEECHKKFFKKFHLQRHERVHTGEKPYLCVFCDKKFTSKTNMDTHIQSVHLKIKPFRCGYCEKGFGRKKLMVMHVRKYHIHNAPMGELTDDDDEEDVDGDEIDDDEELSDGQPPAAEGGTAAALLSSIVHSAATSSASLATAAAAAGVAATVSGSSSSSAAATAAQAAATTRLVYLRVPDGKETAAQAVKQYVVIRQEQVHAGAGDVAVEHRAVSSTAGSMDSTFTIAVDGNSSGHSANSPAAIVWQPAAAAAGDGAEGTVSLQQQQQTVRQQQQLNTSANIVWQFEQMPAGSVLQAVQASDGTVILLATPASPSSLASVAGGQPQLAVVPSADGTPETILAVETVAVSADALLAPRDREAAQQQQHFPSDGGTA